MSTYYVAFSNDSREWTFLHDGYAEWVGCQITDHNNFFSISIIYVTFILQGDLKVMCNMRNTLNT